MNDPDRYLTRRPTALPRLGPRLLAAAILILLVAAGCFIACSVT